MDPIAIGNWLLGVLSSPAAAPVAMISLLVNVFLYRGWQACQDALIEAKSQEIERQRADYRQARDVDNAVMREMTALLESALDREAEPTRRGRVPSGRDR